MSKEETMYPDIANTGPIAVSTLIVKTWKGWLKESLMKKNQKKNTNSTERFQKRSIDTIRIRVGRARESEKPKKEWKAKHTIINPRVSTERIISA